MNWDWIKARLSEASTWAGLSGLAVTTATAMPSSWQPYAFGFAGIAAGLAVMIREKGTKTPEEIAADAFAAARVADPKLGAGIVTPASKS